MEQKKLLMIVNLQAGRRKSKEALFDALSIFSEAGYLISIHITNAPKDAIDFIIKEGKKYDVITAVGGDGTLNECVSGLMCLKDPPLLSYLPRGSTNDFANSLHISSDPIEAAKTAVKNMPRRLDIGQWNTRYFVYVASFGAFTRTSYTAPQAAKNTFGHLAYILEGMKDLDTLRPYHLHLTADGEEFHGDYLFGAICNSTSIGGFMKFEQEQVIIDDGLFELLLIPNPRNPAELQEIMAALIHQEYDRLIFRHAASLRLETEENLPWSLDGEYAASTPIVEIKNHYQALSILF